MKNLSHHCSIKISSNFIRNAYRKKKGIKKMFFIPMSALTIMLAFLMTGCAGLPTSRNIDKTDYPFVDDPKVIGKWESVDFVKRPENFTVNKRYWKGDLFLKNLAFIKDGKMLGAVDTEIIAPISSSWSKDVVLNKTEQTASKYEIKEIDGAAYMFFEWKTGDYTHWRKKPFYYVLKKIDSKDYSDFKPEQIVWDKVDYPFVNDEQMLGCWRSVDFVPEKHGFKPSKKSWVDNLFLTELKCAADGKITFTTTSGQSSNPSISWTRGLILDKNNKTASKCEIREMDGSTYMFYEWKSGDYTYRGMKPSYYVLKKADELKKN